MVYLPTKQGHFWSFSGGKYSSTMVRIWVMVTFHSPEEFVWNGYPNPHHHSGFAMVAIFQT
jgi:hypothetical protein